MILKILSPLACFLYLISYTIGSIPSAIMVCNLFSLPDPRLNGSGNPGATNVQRLGGKFPALFTFLLDAMKGAGIIIIANYMKILVEIKAIAAFAVILGHVYPSFGLYKGGKGAATGAGILLMFLKLSALPVLVIFSLTVLLTRVVAIATLSAALSALLITWLPIFNINCAYKISLSLIVIIIFYRHLPNLKELSANFARK
eukprot:GHVL01010393.1.p1 GENE.GHVL01010393.1~~GHVL01010393.1.p1  ORF type:complete len:201 (-),score=12.53 GHVL01010393.1:455-1057(-)